VATHHHADVSLDNQTRGRAAWENVHHVAEQMFLYNKVVPLLGAGVNLCGRLPSAHYARGRFLPSGHELAADLATAVPEYPPAVLANLARVSQSIQHVYGWGGLYFRMRRIFALDYEATIVHRLLARVPGWIRKLPPDPEREGACQLIITTNYDDTLEREFLKVHEPFDVVSYTARDCADRGKFIHWPYEGGKVVIENASTYVTELPLKRRTVILKLHGTVNRSDDNEDSYVVTEDDYIDYLARTDLSGLLPSAITAQLKKSNILFLGYSMQDWNLRAIFHRLWEEQKYAWTSWAIRQPLPPLTAAERADPRARQEHNWLNLERRLEERLWRDRRVDVIETDLKMYMELLAARAYQLIRRERLNT
jgi:SIR2-like domain